jgi:Pseudouridylate synthases, 23S RNA-specific
MNKTKKSQELMEYLTQNNKDLSNKKIKSLLKYKKVRVNNKVTTKYNQIITDKDVVKVDFTSKKVPLYLDVIYEDKDVIVLNKRAGLLTVSTDKEKQKTLYRDVSDYVKMDNPKNRIFVIHRLDKDTSGIVMFAKKEKVKKIFQENWDSIAIIRSYKAVLEGNLDKKEGTLTSYLKEVKEKVVVTSSKEGKIAITKFKVLKNGKYATLVDIKLETGRKNQIRVQFKDFGYPVSGDRKYGCKQNLIKRLALHADKLVVKNPLTGKTMTFEVEMPNEFRRLTK